MVPKVEVPNITGSTVSDAKAALYYERLGVSKSVRGVKPNWVVTDQVPTAGNEVEVGNTVHLTVAVEPEEDHP